MLPDLELTPGRRDELIARIGAFVVRRRLEVPFLFFLEASRPLTFLGSQSLVLSQPALAPFFGWERLDEFRLLLEDRANVDRLIANIETGAAHRDRPPEVRTLPTRNPKPETRNSSEAK